MKRDKIEPLYRKVNTRARNVWHNKGDDARHDRGTKGGTSRSMKKDVSRGLDYTPLYRFLLSKVGKQWDDVLKEAESRVLDKQEIYYIVKQDNTGNGYSLFGEGTIFSTLYVDDDGLLQLVKPDLKNEDFQPCCSCCTYTFNGTVLNRKHNGEMILQPMYIKG